MRVGKKQDEVAEQRAPGLSLGNEVHVE